LRSWAQAQGGFDLAVGHNSYAQIVAARLSRIKSVTLMDYEHQPANHLAFRLASRVIVPQSFPKVLCENMAREGKVKRYDGIKEDVYLADFAPDPRFAETLKKARRGKLGCARGAASARARGFVSSLR
jgi:predicted glycosyltransferase